MRWKLGLLVAVAVAVAVEMRSAPASLALKGPGTIRITDRRVALAKVDFGRPGVTPGDLQITRQLLFNKRITPKSIGHSELVCTYTGGKSRNCSGTFVLPRGKLVVGGQVLFSQFFQLAVLGGTGFYENVRGTVTVTSLSGRPPQNLVLFRLVT